MRRCIGYVRVSTEDQGREGTSLDSQREALATWCAREGWELVRVVEDQASGTAGVAERPGLRAALESLAELAGDAPALRKGQAPPADAPALLVVRRDRLARSVAVACAVEEVLGGHGCVLMSSDVAADDTPESQLMARIFDAFAEYERHKILWRTALGRSARRKQGRWLGGNAPWGLTPAADGAWVVDATRADAIREVFRMDDDGESATDIAAWLNAAGWQTARGCAWTHVQVRRVLGQRQWYLQAGVV